MEMNVLNEAVNNVMLINGIANYEGIHLDQELNSISQKLKQVEVLINSKTIQRTGIIFSTNNFDTILDLDELSTFEINFDGYGFVAINKPFFKIIDGQVLLKDIEVDEDIHIADFYDIEDVSIELIPSIFDEVNGFSIEINLFDGEKISIESVGL